jgi:hypothetical protein
MRFRLLAASVLLLCLHGRAAVIHCGTMDWLARHGGKPQLKKWAKGAALGPQARTLETAHFSLNYALHGLHRIKTIPADSGLVRVTDSLYASLPGALTGNRADSAVYAKLDAMAAPHPAYADTMAGFFEAARAYYVDHLGMRAPHSIVPSHYFAKPFSAGGRYSVDVVDIGTADDFYEGEEIYALTFSAADGGMLMENDFLFSTVLGPGGIPAGDSISSRF